MGQTLGAVDLWTVESLGYCTSRGVAIRRRRPWRWGSVSCTSIDQGTGIVDAKAGLRAPVPRNPAEIRFRSGLPTDDRVVRESRWRPSRMDRINATRQHQAEGNEP